MRNPLLELGTYPSAISVSRYRRYKEDKLSLEDIAKADHAKVRTVKRSIQTVELYFQMYNLEALQAGEVSFLLANLRDKHRAVQRALHATKAVTVNGDSEEEVIQEEDHDTQLRAVNELNMLSGRLLHKRSPTVVVNTEVDNSSSVNANMGSTFEDSLRALEVRMKEQGHLRHIESKALPAHEEGE